VSRFHDDQLTAVVLAGGKGTRLRPYTTSFPKPLVPVGDRPIIDILIGQLVHAGITRVVCAVGHLAELIEAYCRDGRRYGPDVTIEYAREEEPLGTVGPLSLLKDRLPPHFLVINGDVLCDLDYGAFLAAHRRGDPPRLLSISTHRRILCSEYGVLKTDTEGRVCEYLEKPSYPLSVSEGIYAFSREALRLVPRGRRFDFPDLVNALLLERMPVFACEHAGLWLDIGRPEDYERAQQIVAEYPERFTMHKISAASQATLHASEDAALTGHSAEPMSRSSWPEG
jgi:NDP-sugar pyrophosphorylase family protein